MPRLRFRAQAVVVANFLHYPLNGDPHDDDDVQANGVGIASALAAGLLAAEPASAQGVGVRGGLSVNPD